MSGQNWRGSAEHPNDDPESIVCQLVDMIAWAGDVESVIFENSQGYLNTQYITHPRDRTTLLLLIDFYDTYAIIMRVLSEVTQQEE